MKKLIKYSVLSAVTVFAVLSCLLLSGDKLGLCLGFSLIIASLYYEL